MILRIAWKNVWRSKRRSAIVVVAIALGLWGGLFAAGVMEGMSETMVNTAIERELTHIQIHLPGFRDERSIAMSIPAPDSVMTFVSSLPDVYAATSRCIVDGMISSPATSQGARIEGIVPRDEESATSLAKEIVQGTCFGSDRKNVIVLGQKLADKLEVKLNSKIVLTFQNPDGSLVYAAFRIGGIFQTASLQYDAATVYVTQADLFPLLGTPKVHEIGVRLTSAAAVPAVLSRIQSHFPALEAMSWREIAPELKLTADSTNVFMNIFLGIILVALLFGITNTMLMSVLDRIREFGMLMAVGMKRRQVFVMVILETVALSLTGGIAGMILGAGTIAFLSKTGIDLSMFSQGLAYYGMGSLLIPTVPATTYPLLTLMIIVTAILAAIYPAVKVMQLRPASAIRTF